MSNETAKKVSFLILSVFIIFFISWLIESADFFSTMVLVCIVAIFCCNIEENYAFFKKENHSKNSIIPQENQTIIQKKIITYIINMDKATDRLNFILPQVKALGLHYEKINAIDGKKISKKEWNDIVDEESFCNFFKMLPEPGTIGCSLSHKKAWEHFLKSDSEFALIFEDDAKFEPKLLTEVIYSAIEKKHLWDIIGFELNHYGYPQKIAKLTSDRFLVLYMTNVKHSGAYLVNRIAVKKMLERFYPIKMPLDHYFTSSWEFGLKFCGVEPRIVEQKFGGSQIKTAPVIKLKDKKTLCINILYNIYVMCMQTLYNFLLYLSSRRNI